MHELVLEPHRQNQVSEVLGVDHALILFDVLADGDVPLAKELQPFGKLLGHLVEALFLFF